MTIEVEAGSSVTFISTHTLTWSVTVGNVGIVGSVGISTHTLTWSVTGLFVQLIPPNFYFNSHAHVERDYHKTYHNQNQSISTHTLTWSVT